MLVKMCKYSKLHDIVGTNKYLAKLACVNVDNEEK